MNAQVVGQLGQDLGLDAEAGLALEVLGGLLDRLLYEVLVLLPALDLDLLLHEREHGLWRAMAVGSCH